MSCRHVATCRRHFQLSLSTFAVLLTTQSIQSLSHFRPGWRLRGCTPSTAVYLSAGVRLYWLQKVAWTQDGDGKFPNGMSTCFGPGSARQNDRGTLTMSGLDCFLVLTQAHLPPHLQCMVFGDSIFRISPFSISN